MVDRNNLNRIKGILSAKQGAEVPKFTVGGEIPTYNPKDADFTSFVTQNKLSISPLIWEQYHRLKKVVPTASTEQLGSYWTGQTALPNGAVLADVLQGKSTTAIPGANPAEGNPNAAVTTAASINGAVQAEQAAKEVAAQTKPEEANTTGTTGTTGTTTTGDIKSDASSGINLTPEQQQDLKKATVTGMAGQALSSAFDVAGQAVKAKQAATDSDLTKGADMAYNTAAGIVENLGPVGKVVGTAMKTAAVAGDLIQEMGGGTDQQTKMDKWMDSSFFSWNIGMLNGFAGKNTDSFGIDQDTIAQVGSSYGGTVTDLNDAASKAGKKYGLFSSKARKKANEAIATAKNQQNLMGSIADNAMDQRLAVQSMGEQAGLAYSMMTDGGYNQKYTYAAKDGGILEWNPVETLEWEPQVELNWDLSILKEGGSIDLVEELEWIPEFKSGGKTEEFDVPEIEETTQKNVIPEGALHKNKHHMEHADGLTKKGIPVIDEDGEQQAEIEHSEIIFTLEVTRKLEEYYEIFYSDESSNKEKEQAAIEAGKLLVFQILENTEDRTGLIESCKKGGSLTLKTTTDDLIEEVLEWMPTVVIVEEKEPEEKPKKKEEKSDKELMKEAIKEVLIELLTK